MGPPGQPHPPRAQRIGREPVRDPTGDPDGGPGGTQVQPDDSAISLRKRTSATSASVLLFHRDSDRGARRLHGALEDSGMSVESVEYDDDRFDTAPYRIDLLARLGRFLEEDLR